MFAHLCRGNCVLQFLAIVSSCNLQPCLPVLCRMCYRQSGVTLRACETTDSRSYDAQTLNLSLRGVLATCFAFILLFLPTVIVAFALVVSMRFSPIVFFSDSFFRIFCYCCQWVASASACLCVYSVRLQSSVAFETMSSSPLAAESKSDVSPVRRGALVSD